MQSKLLWDQCFSWIIHLYRNVTLYKHVDQKLKSYISTVRNSEWPAGEDIAGFKLSPNSGASASWFSFRPTSNTCICVFHVKRHFFWVISIFDHFLFTWIKALSSCCFLCSVFSNNFCQRWFRSSNLLRKLLASSTALDSIRSFPAFLTASTVDWWAKTSFCSTYNCNSMAHQ